MVNKYTKKKAPNPSWSEKTMTLAMNEANKTTVFAAAKKYGINLSTLQRHVKKGCAKKVLGRFAPIFTDAQELELVQYLFNMDNLYVGLTRQEFLELVFQYAEQNKIKHRFKSMAAGKDWYMGFRARHPEITPTLTRRPEATSTARAGGFNTPQVELFFDLLEGEIRKHNIDATRIYNMDETGVQTTSNKLPRVLCKSGKKQVGIVSSAERGKLTTVVCCCNAAGSFIPPFLIYGRKRMEDRLLDGAPPGTRATCSDNGWINGPVFLEWLRHFVEMTRPTAEKKVILVMDNHESHKQMGALEYASKNHVIFVSLAQHTTHPMQPLDACVYGPLKKYFEQVVSVFQEINVGRISQYEIAKLFGDAYTKAASARNAVKGFSCTGIWPTNRNIFNHSGYVPSSLTDRPEPSLNPADDEDRQTIVKLETSNDHGQVKRRESSVSDDTVSPTVLDCLFGRSNCETPMPTVDITELATQQLMNPMTPDKERNKNEGTTHPTPIDIRPLATIPPNKTIRKRKCQRTEILTGTPIKEEPIEKETKRQHKTNAVKRNLKNIKPSTSSNNVNKKVKKGPKRNKNDTHDYRCLVCYGVYVNPPVQDWIKCDDCEMWAHETCTSYAGMGPYYCDLCHEL